MSSKYWIDKVVAQPATKQDDGPVTPGKHARLAEMLLAMKKKKG